MDLKKTGRLIIKKRKELNLTQEQLSEKLFVTPQAISLWEKGQRFPDPDAQVMIYKVLDHISRRNQSVKKGVRQVMGGKVLERELLGYK